MPTSYDSHLRSRSRSELSRGSWYSRKVVASVNHSDVNIGFVPSSRAGEYMYYTWSGFFCRKTIHEHSSGFGRNGDKHRSISPILFSSWWIRDCLATGCSTRRFAYERASNREFERRAMGTSAIRPGRRIPRFRAGSIESLCCRVRETDTHGRRMDVDPFGEARLSKSIRWTRDTRPRTRQLWRGRSGSGDRSVRAYQCATDKKEIIQHLEELDRNLHPRTVTGARISYSVGEKVRGPV